MIKINLLPQNMTKGGAAAGPNKASRPMTLVILAGVIMAAINGLAGWMAFNCVITAKEDADRIQVKYDKVDKQIKDRMQEADLVRKYREVVKNQMDVLKSLDPPDRLLWCEKLNMLSNLMPTDVFVSEITVLEHVEMVETEASKAAHVKWERVDKKKGPEPTAVKKPLITYDMKLTGLALGRDSTEQLNNVIKFNNALTTYRMTDAQGKERRFMDGFDPTIGMGAITTTVYEGTPVDQFIFMLKTKAIGTEEQKKPEAAAPTKVAQADAKISQAKNAQKELGI